MSGRRTHERTSGRSVRGIATVATVVAGLVLGGRPAVAHQGFLTTYDHLIERGQVEVMLFTDYTSPSTFHRAEGQRDYFSHMLELKYNPLEQLALEFMLESFEDIGTGEGKFTGYRFEARWRLFEDEVPLNPMVYAEYEDLDPDTRYKMEVSGWIVPPYAERARAEPTREKIMESRLVLSQQIDDWMLAANWINESDFDTGEVAFGYSLGVRCALHAVHARPDWMPAAPGEDDHDAHRREHEEADELAETKLIRPASIALELFGALGDERKLDIRPARQEHYLQPSIMFHVGEHAMLSIGLGFGMSEASDDLLRVVLGWSF